MFIDFDVYDEEATNAPVFSRDGLSFRGRRGRKKFFLTHLGVFIVSQTLCGLLLRFGSGIISFVLFLIIASLATSLMMVNSVKRFHDLSISSYGAFSYTVLVAMVNYMPSGDTVWKIICVFVFTSTMFLYFKEGVQRENKYGPIPK